MAKRIFFIILILFLLGYIWIVSQTKGFPNGQDKIFIIEKGQGAHEISDNLKSEGFIKNSFIFETYVWAKKLGNKFQAGEYALNTGSDIFEITKILTSGKVLPNERKIRITAGNDINYIAGYLENEGIVSKDEFIKVVNSKDIKDSRNYEFLATIPDDKNLEGFLFPDTYTIYKSANAKDIVLKIFDEGLSQKLTPKMIEDIKNHGKTLYEIITMASIIEKEANTDDDMNMVSDIFWRRIDAGMPLQSCATIAYILGENKPQYSYEDTRIESDYNTYLNRGLPPSPICNPGLSAITAAIYPEKNDYWYFLSKSENSETVFSKTLDEHNRNKAKYLK